MVEGALSDSDGGQVRSTTIRIGSRVCGRLRSTGPMQRSSRFELAIARVLLP
jgi:hypothetical protein